MKFAHDEEVDRRIYKCGQLHKERYVVALKELEKAERIRDKLLAKLKKLYTESKCFNVSFHDIDFEQKFYRDFIKGIVNYAGDCNDCTYANQKYWLYRRVSRRVAGYSLRVHSAKRKIIFYFGEEE